MQKLPQIARGLGALLVLASLILLLVDRGTVAGPMMIGGWVLLALGLHGTENLKNIAFTCWIFAAVAASMFYPEPFIQIGSFQLKTLIVPLLQVIMFGMGTTMSMQDFAGVIQMPKGVLLGMGCQFTIMPIVGYSLTLLFAFPPEIAAGIILVGSSPSGLASNVMSFIARANLALSVTLTAVATVMAPIMTPFLMQTLAGAYVPIDFWGMMWSITKIVIFPIIGGLIFHHTLSKRFPRLQQAMPLVSMVGIAVIIAIITASGRDSLLEVGALLILACLLHNLAGYGLGYLGAKLFRMDEASCRTIGLEVGMQNGGLASGIALEMGKVATVGLAPAVFGPMMNITGSTLATWWRNRLPQTPPTTDMPGTPPSP